MELPPPSLYGVWVHMYSALRPCVCIRLWACGEIFSTAKPDFMGIRLVPQCNASRYTIYRMRLRLFVREVQQTHTVESGAPG